MEALPDNAIGVDGDTHLLEHGVDIGVVLGFTTFSHLKEDSATLFDVPSNILELLRGERKSGTSEKKEVALSELLQVDLLLVDFTRVTRLELLDHLLVTLGRFIISSIFSIAITKPHKI